MGTNQDEYTPSTPLEEVERGVEANNADALCELAWRYRHGEGGVKRNDR